MDRENRIVVLECASWYEEDGCVKITNKKGNTVILNKLYSMVWEAIDGEKEILELENILNDQLSKEKIEEILDKMCGYDLLSLRENADSFDIMF